MAVTGEVVWDRNTGRVHARLQVDGPRRHDGTLRMRWNDWQTDAQATVRGTLTGNTVHLVTSAP